MVYYCYSHALFGFDLINSIQWFVPHSDSASVDRCCVCVNRLARFREMKRVSALHSRYAFQCFEGAADSPSSMLSEHACSAWLGAAECIKMLPNKSTIWRCGKDYLD